MEREDRLSRERSHDAQSLPNRYWLGRAENTVSAGKPAPEAAVLVFSKGKEGGEVAGRSPARGSVGRSGLLSAD